MCLLKQEDSICEKKQKIIVSRDNGSPCNHIGNNNDSSEVRQYKIDNGIVKDQTVPKCDFLLLNDDKKTAYFIELKGSDIIKAITQVENTKEMLKKEISGYTSFFRIIYRTGSHCVKDSKTIKWIERYGYDSGSDKQIAIVRNLKYEEGV